MLEPRSQEAFRRNPEGAFLAGENWIYFALDWTLFGYAIWGRPSLDDVQALVRVLDAEIDRPPHAALVDFSGLEFVAREAFDELSSYTLRHEEALAQIVTHAAIVRPGGINGAIVTGFFSVASKPFPISFSSSVESALIDLGRADAGACAASLDAARAHVSRESTVLRALRAYLSSHLSAPDMAEAARALGLSTRTLQRRLAEKKTSFASEVQVARLCAAERLLAETRVPVTSIALDLGFNASQYFATWFRKRTGCTPSEFREKAHRRERRVAPVQTRSARR